MSQLLLFNKPYDVLCQFSGEPGDKTLADYISVKNVYPAGRLDKNSEGLLLLTDDGQWQHQLAHPDHKTWKRYWVQVEGIPESDRLEQLRNGLILNDGLTLPARCQIIEPPDFPERIPPIRFRQKIPTCWIEISIREGKNRQIRRMTAHIGHPTLRLIRVSIGDYLLDGLQPGEWLKLQLPTLGKNTSLRWQRNKSRTH